MCISRIQILWRSIKCFSKALISSKNCTRFSVALKQCRFMTAVTLVDNFWISPFASRWPGYDPPYSHTKDLHTLSSCWDSSFEIISCGKWWAIIRLTETYESRNLHTYESEILQHTFNTKSFCGFHEVSQKPSLVKQQETLDILYNAPFSLTRMTVAKYVTENPCLVSSHLTAILRKL